MSFEGSALAAFLVGLLGGAHCIGMCGGIVGTLTAGLPREVRLSPARVFVYQLAYNAGRIAAYTAMGALLGAMGTLAFQILPLHDAQRVLYALAAVVMILLGLYLTGWWRVLAVVERLGVRLWRGIEPIGRRFLPVRSPAQALGLGLIWAFIPCGLVYSVLVWAAAAGTPWRGATLLFAFGVGTLPNLLAMGMLTGAAARLTSQRWFRVASGLLVMGLGVFALVQLFLP